MTETTDRRIRWTRVLALLLLPLVALGVAFVVVILQHPRRFDPRFFTPEYLARYNTPGAVALGFE